MTQFGENMFLFLLDAYVVSWPTLTKIIEWFLNAVLVNFIHGFTPFQSLCSGWHWGRPIYIFSSHQYLP